MDLHMLTVGSQVRSFCLERTLQMQCEIEGSS